MLCPAAQINTKDRHYAACTSTKGHNRYIRLALGTGSDMFLLIPQTPDNVETAGELSRGCLSGRLL